jgi:hypothetical protein
MIRVATTFLLCVGIQISWWHWHWKLWEVILAFCLVAGFFCLTAAEENPQAEPEENPEEPASPRTRASNQTSEDFAFQELFGVRIHPKFKIPILTTWFQLRKIFDEKPGLDELPFVLTSASEKSEQFPDTVVTGIRGQHKKVGVRFSDGKEIFGKNFKDVRTYAKKLHDAVKIN